MHPWDAIWIRGLAAGDVIAQAEPLEQRVGLGRARLVPLVRLRGAREEVAKAVVLRVHPHYDGSLHLSVPTADAERLIELGWAEFHPVVEQGLVPPIVIMLYGPRDEDELAAAKHVAEIAYLAAGGATLDLTPPRSAPEARPPA
jgi:hypothetical protein